MKALSPLRSLPAMVGAFLFGVPMLPFTPRQLFAAIQVLIVVALLSLTHYTAYRMGRAVVSRDWAEDRAQAAQRLAEEIQAARVVEQELRKKADDGIAKLATEKKRGAVAAQSAADELRLLQEALARSVGPAYCDTSASTGADGAGIGGLLAECGKSYQGVARDADGLAIKVTGLQSYITEICRP